MNTPPIEIAETHKYVWYAFKKLYNDPAASWKETCWKAPTLEAALKLRENAMYHTEFHSGIPQKLVKKTSICTACADVITKPDDCYVTWTNGVPDSFGFMGVGFGYRVTWLGVMHGWVLAFPDAYHVRVQTYHPTLQGDGEVITLSLEDFVANMPTTDSNG